MELLWLNQHRGGAELLHKQIVSVEIDGQGEPESVTLYFADGAALEISAPRLKVVFEPPAGDEIDDGGNDECGNA